MFRFGLYYFFSALIAQEIKVLILLDSLFGESRRGEEKGAPIHEEEEIIYSRVEEAGCVTGKMWRLYNVRVAR